MEARFDMVHGIAASFSLRNQDSEKVPRLVNMNPDKSLEAGGTKIGNHNDLLDNRPSGFRPFICIYAKNDFLIF